ncbi:MAG: NADH-quinone oxidoreductase subunit L [Desulfovibrionaceae bacterium]|nr:NADH-quinone oxidoreductase subunit L [Desulfovibrionaceae bacterium]
MLNGLVFACIVLPILAALLALIFRACAIRKALVIGTGVVLALASLALAKAGSFRLAADTMLGINVNSLVMLLDFALMAVILIIGLRLTNWIIVCLAIAQIAGTLYVEGFIGVGSGAPFLPEMGIFADNLSLVMVLVISLVGSLICIYGLGYMRVHEEHLHLEKSRQPRFFFYMLLFLGAMNGLVLSNNLLWAFFFWELTTLCSFMLIGHDGTDEARRNATRALWMNMLGGMAFVFGMMMLKKAGAELSMLTLISSGNSLYLMPIVLFCFAGFTKSAQVPFQSWLCGAMVAPTPVSALLHSSTMVKAGVFLVLRLAPGFEGTWFSVVLAIFGAFTFLVTSALAVGQSNGKKILAYSTIANLGLIIACAGINTQAAIAAAIMIIVFHAVSKALLFLCVGAIEQRIESRNIDDMRSLYQLMPRTAVITAIGIVSMMLPPFGMLLGKWMAIESALNMNFAMPIVITMLALGSALTVLFWGRWAGMLLGAANPKPVRVSDNQSFSISFVLMVLTIMAVLASLLSPLLYVALVQPATLAAADPASGYSIWGALGSFYNNTGAFAVYPLFIAIALGFAWALHAARKASKVEGTDPFLSGANARNENGEPGFIGPMREVTAPTMGNYYLSNIFGEGKLTGTANAVAITLIALMLGGVMWN